AKLAATINVDTRVVLLSSGLNMAAMLGRFRVPSSFFCFQVGDSGKKGRMMINGIAGITPEIKVYRQASCAPRIAGRLAPHFAASPNAPLTIKPPTEETACVYPRTLSRCFGFGKSSASHATAATNSTQTPMNVVHRSTNRTGNEVAKAAARADTA